MNERTAIYLDYNATTPPLPEVVDAMLPWLRSEFGNPSSDHPYGRRARAAVEQARGEVAALIGAAPHEIVFTSGGTEANNLALFGSLAKASRGRRVLTSVIEHPAISAPCARLQQQGFGIDRIGVDSQGRLLLDDAIARLSEQTALVSVMHSNNETGVLQPIAELARAARRLGARVHTDAAQSVGKVAVSVDELGVDLLSIAGHKLYAPKGVGALYVRSDTPLEPLLLGAGHERGLRPGTENVASIVGLGIACVFARINLEENGMRSIALRDRLFQLLAREIDGLVLNGHPSERLPNTLNVRFPRVQGSALLEKTPEIAASTGSACHAGGESASAVLLAMGIEPEAALGSVRLTLGQSTSETEIERAAAALVSAWRTLTGAESVKRVDR